MIQLDLLAAPSARRFDPQTSRDAAESARELAARTVASTAGRQEREWRITK